MISEGKPLPDILPETKAYWEAASRQELLVQKCRSCSNLQYFPRLLCHRCLSEDLGWIRSSGKGMVYSYTIIHQAAHKSFAPDVPYVYAIIELKEGVRMISNVVHIEPSKVHIGMKVRVYFHRLTADIHIPRFEPDHQTDTD